MKLPHRRKFLHLAAGATALPAVSRIAMAQAYPTRLVRIVVGFPPGGVASIAARLIGQRLSERLGQPFIIDNRPGASGNIGTEAVVRRSGLMRCLMNGFPSVMANQLQELRDTARSAGYFANTSKAKPT